MIEIHDPWANAGPPQAKPAEPGIVNPWEHDYDGELPNPWADAPDTSTLDPIIVDPWADQGAT